MYRALIVEDEPEEAARLIDFIRRYGQTHDETFDVVTLRSAMEMLSNKERFDLVFLDINLPGISGMEAAQLMRAYDEETPIIFVTSLAKYAAKGYEVGAVGFIIKPVTWGNFSMALDRALRVIRNNAGRTVVIPTEDGMRVVSLSQVSHVEVRGHQLTYHLTDGEQLEARGALGQLEEDLAGSPVIRVSKSCLVNMDKIARIRSSELKMSTGAEVRVSRTRRKEVLAAITDYLGGFR